MRKDNRSNEEKLIIEETTHEQKTSFSSAKQQILRQLTDYPNQKRNISLLRYELNQIGVVSQEEVLEAMSFPGADAYDIQHAADFSDRIPYIVENYKVRAAELSCEKRSEMLLQLRFLEKEIERISFYVSLLDDEKRKVIELLFFQQYSLQKASELMNITPWTVRRLRDSGIDQLAEMLLFVQAASI